MNTTNSDSGTIIFSKTNDGTENKASGLSILVTGNVQTSRNGTNTIYEFSWIAGTNQTSKKHSLAFVGTSGSVMQQILKNVDQPQLNTKINVNQLTDSQVWRFYSKNAWEQLSAVSDHSMLKNDYIFWAWDEVNNQFRLTSINTEMGSHSGYAIMQSDDSNQANENLMTFDNPKYTVWKCKRVAKNNNLFENREFLYPNTMFEVVDGTTRGSGNVAGVCFDQIVTDIGDSKMTAVNSLKSAGAVGPVGNHIVKRAFPNNTHKLYDFADVYRKYKISTFCKSLTFDLSNAIGPPVGSSIEVLLMPDNYNQSSVKVDMDFSDKYIITEKEIIFSTIDQNNYGKAIAANPVFTTTFRVSTDNFDKPGFPNVETAAKLLSKLA
jgi:hypothetical protein